MTIAIPPADVAGALDSAPCGFVSFTDTGDIRFVNRTLADLLGYAADEIVGRSVETVFTTPTRIFYQTHFFPLLKLQGRVDEIFLTLRPKVGDPIHALANAVRQERDGETVNDCVLMRIQERHKFEDALVRARKAAEEANVARMRFLSMLSHDLRTPLSAIIGYTELMLMGIRGEITPEQEKDLRRMKDASAFLLSMLNDVLAFVKHEAGQIDISMRDVRVRDVITHAEALVAPRIRDAGIRYASGECRDDLLVRADDSRLQQILLNLLTNALKYTPRGGSVTVSCEEGRDQIRVRVADSGPGIDAERLGWIFEPFTQLEQRRETKDQGVGLGLAISRQLARAMAGDIIAESAPGHGSTFTVILQRAGR